MITYYLSYVLYNAYYPQPNASSSQPSSDDSIDAEPDELTGTW